MKHLIIAGTAAALLLATVSCSGPGRSDDPGRHKKSAGPASYLTVGNTDVTFIQWRATSDGHLHGTITEANVGGSAPADTLSVSSAPFIGTMNGRSVTLNFAVLYFLYTRTDGTLRGRTLTLRVPQSDGTIERAKFSRSNEAGYHHAIATLRSTMRHTNLLASQQQARQQQRPANSQNEKGAQRTLSALYTDSSLAFSGMLGRGLTRFADDIQIAQSHLATEKHDASGSNSYCRATFVVTGDALSVNGDLQTVRGDVQAIVPDFSTIQLNAAAATFDVRELGKAGLPVPSGASGVIANAKANLTRAIAKANSYIDQINAIDAQAHSIADNMARRSCSGARSGSVTPPISPIK
jgi:hypothetical protein